MQKFKFRAKLSEVEHGGYCYGYVVYRYGKVYLEDAINHDLHSVEEENIDQLVGYDAEGREVYEGDEVRVENGVCYATVSHFLKTNPCKDFDLTELAKKYGWKLEVE